MFNVGDRIFWPMRGSGVVESIEEREMLGEVKEYFIIQLQMSGMTMMVPTQGNNQVRFRPISKMEVAEEVLASFTNNEIQEENGLPLKERIKVNQAKLQLGTLEACGEVIKSLTQIQQDKALNNSEKTILMDARKFFSDELSMIKRITPQEAITIIDGAL